MDVIEELKFLGKFKKKLGGGGGSGWGGGVRVRHGVIKKVIVINCNLITFSKIIEFNCN